MKLLGANPPIEPMGMHEVQRSDRANLNFVSATRFLISRILAVAEVIGTILRLRHRPA